MKRNRDETSSYPSGCCVSIPVHCSLFLRFVSVSLHSPKKEMKMFVKQMLIKIHNFVENEWSNLIIIGGPDVAHFRFLVHYWQLFNFFRNLLTFDEARFGRLGHSSQAKASKQCFKKFYDLEKRGPFLKSAKPSAGAAHALSGTLFFKNTLRKSLKTLKNTQRGGGVPHPSIATI